MSAFEATFGCMDCHVRVESRSNGHSELMFAATPFVISRDPHIFNWFPNGVGEPIEFLAFSEDAALAHAAMFLTDWFGGQRARFVKAPEREKRPRISRITRTQPLPSGSRQGRT
jgi:hypothetical protein